MTVRRLLGHPSAFVPIALSLAALAFLLGHVAVFGIGDNGGDEGTPARVFQLALAVDFCVMGLFAVSWLPRSPRPALLILAVQIVAAAIPIVTVLVLES